MGAGSCRDADGSPYDTILYPADTASECESACSAAVPSSRLAGYHHHKMLGLCYCNVAGEYLTGWTGIEKCVSGAPCATGKGGAGPVASSSGGDWMVCHRNGNASLARTAAPTTAPSAAPTTAAPVTAAPVRAPQVKVRRHFLGSHSLLAQA